MKSKIAVIAAVLTPILVTVMLQESIAQTYTQEDNSEIHKVVVEKRQQSYLANYIVRYCPDNTSIVDKVLLHSDKETLTLGVNKVVGAGQCTYYGAVMQASDLGSLGTTIILKDRIN